VGVGCWPSRLSALSLKACGLAGLELLDCSAKKSGEKKKLVSARGAADKNSLVGALVRAAGDYESGGGVRRARVAPQRVVVLAHVVAATVCYNKLSPCRLY